jgi:hypothetical protein
MATPRVFVSMGTPYNDKYTAFRDALEMLLRDRLGVDARIIGKNEYPSGSPVHKIRDVMSTCNGVLIVAYERKFVESGVERPRGEGERAITSEKYTTPWNHVESALAFALGIPLYVISETGLTEEALIESKVDWYVQRVNFTAEDLNKPNVVESLRAWIDDRVRSHAAKPRSILSGFVKLKLSELTGEEWGVIITIFTLVFGLGVVVGKLPNIFRG